MHIWCSFPVKTNAIFNVVLGICRVCSKFVCMHSKEKRLLKLCTLSACLSYAERQLRYTVKRRVCNLLSLGHHCKHTYTHTHTHTLFFLKHLGFLCCCAGKSKFPSTKTIFHLEEETQIFVYSLLHSITPSLVCLTFHTHDLIFCLVALQIRKLMPQLSAEACMWCRIH